MQRRRPAMDGWRRSFTRRFMAFSLLIQAPALLVWWAVSFTTGVVFSLLVALYIPPLLHRALYWRDDTHESSLRVWATEVPMFVLWSAGALHVFFALPIALVAGVIAWRNHDLSVLPHALGAGHLVALAMSAYGAFVRRLWVKTRTYTLPVPSLPEGIEGLRVAQISDVHCGPHMPRWQLDRVARQTLATRPDVIFLTGDFINIGTGYVDDITHLAKSLSAPLGVFAVLGNHDYYGATDEVADALRAGGVRVLRNERVTLKTERGAVELVGIDDNHSRRHDLAKAFAGLDTESATIVLAHDPDLTKDIQTYLQPTLMLSGHTHAGQFAVPWLWRRWNPTRLRYRYTAGVYPIGRGYLHVHSGIGTSGPPVRIGVAPEVVLMVLQRGERLSPLA